MLHQIAALKQQRKILPSQIELLNLMYLPNLEFEQKINQELNENPFLEEAQSSEEASCRNGEQRQSTGFPELGGIWLR